MGSEMCIRDRYSVPLNTKAEQILRNTLLKKQMCADEIETYNVLPDSLKMMTRAEACARLEEIEKWLDDNQKEVSEYTDEEIEQRNAAYLEHILCKKYIQCMATGSEHSLGRIDSMIKRLEDCLYEEEVYFDMNDKGHRNRRDMLKFLLDVLYDIREKAQNGDYDYQTILDKLDKISLYWDLRCKAWNFEYYDLGTFDEYAQRYEQGEDIASILF